MSKYVIATDGAIAEDTDHGVFSDVIAGATLGLMDNEEDLYGGSSLQIQKLTAAFVGSIGGGYIARRRALAGKKAIGNFLY